MSELAEALEGGVDGGDQSDGGVVYQEDVREHLRELGAEAVFEQRIQDRPVCARMTFPKIAYEHLPRVPETVMVAYLPREHMIVIDIPGPECL